MANIPNPHVKETLWCWDGNSSLYLGLITSLPPLMGPTLESVRTINGTYIRIGATYISPLGVEAVCVQ